MDKLTINELYTRISAPDCKPSFEKILDELSHYTKICIVGMGYFGEAMLPLLKERLKGQIVCVADSDPGKQGKDFFGFRCVSFDDLSAFKDEAYIFICVHNAGKLVDDFLYNGYKVINPTLKCNAITSYEHREALTLYKKNRDKIELVYALLTDEMSKQTFLYRIWHNLFPEDFIKESAMSEVYCPNQYFPRDLIHLGENEVFVDCGGYNGDTIRLFLQKCNNSFEYIYSFEIESGNFSQLVDYIKSLPYDISGKISAMNKGLWYCKETMPIYGCSFGTRVGGEALQSTEEIESLSIIEFDALDSILEHREDITFIKMDIEGSEQAAMQGAKEIIKSKQPKLAISVYHKPEDAYEIPLLIHELNSHYSLYLRHHGTGWFPSADTVCYALS